MILDKLSNCPPPTVSVLQTPGELSEVVPSRAHTGPDLASAASLFIPIEMLKKVLWGLVSQSNSYLLSRGKLFPRAKKSVL